MTEKDTVDMAKYNVLGEMTNALGIKSIEGEEIHIIGLKSTRGQPSKYTNQEYIGEDGKTEYNIITTKETFDRTYKEEGIIKINNFFVTPAIATQINRVPNVQQLFEDGKKLGACKPIKRQSAKDKSNSYWCLAFPEDEDYNSPV